jgi:DNA polymerase
LVPVIDVNKTNGIEGIRVSYKRELNSIKPDLVAAMGATTAQTVFGKITTVHPSYLLRLPDADAKAREYQRLVDDLKIAAKVLRKSARAA